VRTALIGGGSGGLGQAVTEAFLAAGWRCVVPFRDPGRAERLRALAKGRPLELVEADLARAEGAQRAVAVAREGVPPLGAIVNLAGGFDGPGPVHETPFEHFQSQLELNLAPTYRLTAAALPLLLAREEGAIVLVSSRAAVHPFPGAAGYIAAKRAVLALCDSLAVEYGAQGIRTNCVLPGVIDTPANRAAQPQASRAGWTSPERIAEVILWLCSEQARAVNGAQIPV